MEFTVSVIVPVYNAEKFIEKAIHSALQQPEVIELVVVNDGSRDGTLKNIEYLQEMNSKIKLFHHENKINKGRSASRNLGIKKAKGKFIAFLDADDFYLPNRFTNDKKIFQENSEIDGVYNAIGAHFYRDASAKEQDQLELTTIRENVKPEELFDVLFYGGKGHFSIDGLTVKRTVFEMVGYFDEALNVSEDTNLFFKLALKCLLKTGIIDKPVAMRGVHNENVFNSENLYKEYRVKMYESLFFWTVKEQIAMNTIDVLLNRIWVIKYKDEGRILLYIKYWFYLFISSPRLLFSVLSIKYFPIIRLRQKLFPFLFP